MLPILPHAPINLSEVSTMSSPYIPLVTQDNILSKVATSPKRKRPLCNSTRFTIVTLSVLIVLLLVTIFFLVRQPLSNNARGNSGADSRDEEHINVLTDGGLVIGFISDMHLMVNPDDCADNKGWKYGTFGCDSTAALLDITLTAMSRELSRLPRRIVFMLGDAAQHQALDSWNTNITIAAIHSVYEQFHLHFPDTPVFPTIGNNDLEQHNSVPDPSWYDTLLPVFESAVRRGGVVVLPSDFRDEFRAGGYYSATLEQEAEEEGLTVISLNTNIFASNMGDPSTQTNGAARQLEWLEMVLERAKGRTAIIGHHPPMLSLYAMTRLGVIKNHWREDCLEEFLKICKKYHDKIMGIFTGHEHQDSFGAQKYEGVEISAFSMPSVSPIYQGQPSFSIATLSNEYHLLDIYAYHTWLDFYNRLKTEPEFSWNASYSEILSLTELNSTGMLLKADNIISESDGMETFRSLRDKVYQDRLDLDVTAHIFYCYTTNFIIANFMRCIDRFGYDSSMFVLHKDSRYS